MLANSFNPFVIHIHLSFSQISLPFRDGHMEAATLTELASGTEPQRRIGNIIEDNILELLLPFNRGLLFTQEIIGNL